MNNIPTAFNERQISRTILSGKTKAVQKMPVSVVLLNTGGSVLRVQNLENLQKCGFEDIISLELNSDSYNFEEFVRKFPTIKFIIPQEKVTDGDLINIAMEETNSKYVLVLRDALQISSFVLLPNTAAKLAEKNGFCYVPRMVIDKSVTLSNNFIPYVKKGVLKVEPSEFIADNTQTLYPLNYIGLYNREKFIQLGGFDYTIESPYWQNLDLAMRAWLWGEKIKITSTFQLSFLENAPFEDSTNSLSQFRFYLKNLAPVFKMDHGEIPNTAIIRMLKRSPCGTVETIRQFKDAKNWVKLNQFRFKTDAAELIKNWSKE